MMIIDSSMAAYKITIIAVLYMCLSFPPDGGEGVINCYVHPVNPLQFPPIETPETDLSGELKS